MSALPAHAPAALFAVALTTGLLPTTSRANDSSYAGCAGAPATMAGETCVPEKRDDVLLADEALRFTETLVDGKSVWEVEARYTFRNRGADVTLQVGFPIDDPMTETPGAQAVEGYAVTVDGAPATWRAFEPAKEGDDASRAQARAFGYDRVHLTEVHFPGGGERTLTHTYRARASNNNYWMAWHTYILKTGGHWKGGRIGHIVVTVTHARPVAYDHHSASLRGGTWDAATRTWRWEASGWEPTTDLNYLWGNPEAIAWESGQLGDLDEADLSTVKTDRLRSALTKILQVFRHGALPARRTYDPRGKLLREAWGRSLHPVTPAPDPNLTLADLAGETRALVLALDRELERRKARRVALPPAR
ncbi:MAG: hypothetical protein AMXMBFR64_32890 [Myxococcales bacterium]